MSKYLIADLSHSKFMTLFPSCLKLHNLHVNETTVSAFKDTELITCTNRSTIKKISTLVHICIYVFRIIVRLNGDYCTKLQQRVVFMETHCVQLGGGCPSEYLKLNRFG